MGVAGTAAAMGGRGCLGGRPEGGAVVARGVVGDGRGGGGNGTILGGLDFDFLYPPVTPDGQDDILALPETGNLVSCRPGGDQQPINRDDDVAFAQLPARWPAGRRPCSLRPWCWAT